MDFINSHKGYFAATGALLAAIGFGIFFNRKNQGKETVPLPEVYEADLSSLKSQLSTKIEEIRSKVVGADMSEEGLRNLSSQLASYIERRMRDIEREDYFKARESKLKNRFSIYVEMILLWQKEKETQNLDFLQEQQDIFASFNLSSEQLKKVTQNIQVILRERVASEANEAVLSEARSLLIYKAEYLRTEGSALISQLLEVCSSWDKSSLQHLPGILNVIINEQVYSKHPEFIDRLLEVSWAIQSFAQELTPQLNAWEQATTPLFVKLSSELANKTG